MASSKRKSKSTRTVNTEGNEKPKKSKSRQHSTKLKSSSNFPKSIGFVMTILTISLGIYMKKEVAEAEDIATFTTESTILHQYSEIVNVFLEVEQKMIQALQKEPVADLLKSHLRPIQARVSSLRTQTSQYEKLERIPGGPTNFMSTTLAELDSLIKQIDPVDLEVSRIFLEDKGRKQALLGSGLGALNVQDKMYDMFNSEKQYLFHVLAKQGIDLFPPNLTSTTKPADVPLQEGLKLAINLTQSSLHPEVRVTPLELANKLERASKLFAEREILQKKIRDAHKAVGANSIAEARSDPDMFNEIVNHPEHGLVLDEYGKVSNGIKEIIKEDGGYFNLTVPWIRKANSVLRILAKALRDDMLKNDPYVDLRNIVMTDIMNLRARVENLQYSYHKVQADPMLTVKVKVG